MLSIFFQLASAVIFTQFLAQAPSQVQPAFEFLARYDNVRDFTLSSDQAEAYLTIQSANQEVAAIVVMKQQKGKWTAPELASFSGEYKDLEPFLAPNQLRLYFVSNRPLNNTPAVPKDFDIWYVERPTPSSPWSAPINVGSPVNTAHDEFYPALSANGNLYFTSDGPGTMGKDDIFFSAWNGQGYAAPQPLDSTINSAGYEFNAYVAADEEYLIYTKYGTTDGVGSGDLYISKKNKAGVWGAPRNMGLAINSKFMEYCPFVDEASNTLYFTSKRSAIAPANFSSLEAFEKVINQYENGASRIYKTVLTDF